MWPVSLKIVRAMYGYGAPAFVKRYAELQDQPKMRIDRWLMEWPGPFLIGMIPVVGCVWLSGILCLVSAAMSSVLCLPIYVFIVLQFIGPIVITVFLGRVNTHYQTRRVWIDFLMLPYERYQTILYTLSPHYLPYIPVYGIIISVLSALVYFAPWHVLLLVPFIVVEWLQLEALSVAVALFGTFGRSRSTSTIAPLVLSLSLMIARTAAGWLILDTTHHEQIVGTVIGPISVIPVLPNIFVGVGIALLYLLGLELLIRGLLAYALNQAGEASG